MFLGFRVHQDLGLNVYDGFRINFFERTKASRFCLWEGLLKASIQQLQSVLQLQGFSGLWSFVGVCSFYPSGFQFQRWCSQGLQCEVHTP